jgi:uncharacterized hydrophobic protein (TIGR00271 family)
MADKFKLYVSDERALSVYKDIVNGSEPGFRFYAMVAASTAIASFGLIQNSAAVVIGAMLVAPLMTPIFGIALALVRGNAELLGRSIKAEVIGVVVTITLAAVFGFLIPDLEVTSEMLSRTRPNLIDLLIAVFAGFAGAYAMVDEHISPALPGVAIATAIVPPLANVGICISLGAYHGAYGSFLLFFANFLSILLIASLLFFASGMSRELPTITKKDLIKRFGLACIGFLVVAGLLSKGLHDIVTERRLKKSIHTVLIDELAQLPATDVRQILHHRLENKIYVLAHLYSPSDITPSRVKNIQHAIEKKLEEPVEFFVRTTLSKDISSSGLFNRVNTESLDGFYLNRKQDERVIAIRLAEQTIREVLQSKLGVYLNDINLIQISGKPHILATVFGARKLTNVEVGDLEQEIQNRVGNPLIRLVLRHVNMNLYDRWGHSYFEFAQLEKITVEQESLFGEIQSFLKTKFSTSPYLFISSDFSIREGVYHILVELAGTQFFSQEEHAQLQQELSKKTGGTVELYVRSKPEVVVTGQGPTSFDMLKDKMLQRMEGLYPDKLYTITDDSL